MYMYIGSEKWIPPHMFGAKDWFDHQNQSLDGLFTMREDTLKTILQYQYECWSSVHTPFKR